MEINTLAHSFTNQSFEYSVDTEKIMALYHITVLYYFPPCFETDSKFKFSRRVEGKSEFFHVSISKHVIVG